MATVKAIVDYAVSQIGTAEDPLGSNKQKYGAMLDQLPWYLYKDGDKTWIHKVNGFDWCTQFVDATFITVCGIDAARSLLYRPQYNNYGAVVKYAFNYFKAAKRGYTKSEHDPQPGDVIYFQNSKGLSHTGIVVAVDGSSVTTVEGNSGKGNNYVAKSTYKKTSSYIYGYGCPVYDEPKKYPDTPFEIDVLSEKECGLRTGPYSSCQYMGEIKKGSYTVKEVSGDYGKIEAWIYLDTDKIEIEGQTIDGYTIGATYEVTCSELNVRTMASTDGEVVTELKRGASVLCKSITHDEEGNTWMRVENGWVAAIYRGDVYVK